MNILRFIHEWQAASDLLSLSTRTGVDPDVLLKRAAGMQESGYQLRVLPLGEIPSPAEAKEALSSALAKIPASVRAWADERLTRDDLGRVRSSDLLARFRADTGEEITLMRFSLSLDQLGFSRIRSNGIRWMVAVE